MDGDEKRELDRRRMALACDLAEGGDGDRWPAKDVCRLIELERKDATAELNARVTALEEEMRIVRGANKLPGKA